MHLKTQRDGCFPIHGHAPVSCPSRAFDKQLTMLMKRWKGLQVKGMRALSVWSFLSVVCSRMHFAGATLLCVESGIGTEYDEGSLSHLYLLPFVAFVLWLVHLIWFIAPGWMIHEYWYLFFVCWFSVYIFFLSFFLFLLVTQYSKLKWSILNNIPNISL